MRLYTIDCIDYRLVYVFVPKVNVRRQFIKLIILIYGLQHFKSVMTNVVESFEMPNVFYSVDI